MVVKSPFMAFYSAKSKKCHFHFPHKSITCCASHRSGRPSMGALMTSCEVGNVVRVAKSPSMAFLLREKQKMSFSLSSQINNLLRKSMICAPLNGRVDDFLRSHQPFMLQRSFTCSMKIQTFLFQRRPVSLARGHTPVLYSGL